MPMKLSDLTSHAGEWLRGSGPMSEVVISSRIRLARNVAGYPFLAKCSRGQRTTLEHKIRDTILAANIAPQTLYVDLAKLRKELQRAVESEDYERAAKLRDQIKVAEG